MGRSPISSYRWFGIALFNGLAAALCFAAATVTAWSGQPFTTLVTLVFGFFSTGVSALSYRRACFR